MIPRTALIVIFLFRLCSGPASGTEAVPNVDSLMHFINIPSRVSRIKMTWDVPGGNPRGYFVLFDTEPDHTYAGPDPAGASHTAGTGFSQDFADSAPDDVAYYFHIAAKYGEEEIGPVTTAGPYRIDTVPPSGAGVIAPEITPARTVTLFLEAEGASEMYLSNEGYEKNGEWEPVSSFREWELTEGTGDRTVYVRFRDPAWNIADARDTVKLVIPGDIDDSGATDLRDALLALKILAGIAADDVRVCPGAVPDGGSRIGISDAVFILRAVCCETGAEI